LRFPARSARIRNGGIMATSDATTAAANGPGKISDVWAAFLTQATKMPAGPTPDANVAVAYALGWSVGEALTGTQYKTIEHLGEVPRLSSLAERWKLLVVQITFRCQRLQAHLKDVGADTPRSGSAMRTGPSWVRPTTRPT